MNKNLVKFLIVEDNDLDAEKLERGFTKLKISNPLVRARNGYEALEILRGSQKQKALKCPYIILLDINMPKMNGMEFLAQLRLDPVLSASPVFVLSTSDRRQDVNEAFGHNVCGYIVKPVKRQQMLEALTVLNMYWTLGEMPDSQAARKAATSA